MAISYREPSKIQNSVERDLFSGAHKISAGVQPLHSVNTRWQLGTPSHNTAGRGINLRGSQPKTNQTSITHDSRAECCREVEFQPSQ